jgi:hypothetical protein
MRSRSQLLLMAACLAGNLPSMARAGEPSAADLIKLAPVIDSSDRALRSIEVRGSIKGDSTHLRFRAIYRAPDQHALLLADASDGTPLVFVAERRMLIYDPVRPAVLRMEHARSTLILRSKGDAPRLNYSFGASTHDGEPSELVLDLRSICGLPAVEERVVEDANGGYRLFRTDAEGVTTACSIDPRRKTPCASLKVFPKGHLEPSVFIDRIEVDGALRDEDFRFPETARLAGKIAVKDWPGDGVWDALGEVPSMIRAYEARLGANHPGMRKSVRFAALKGIRWDQVRENDRKFSAVMKEILPQPLELPPMPAGGPKPAGSPPAQPLR